MDVCNALVSSSALNVRMDIICMLVLVVKLALTQLTPKTEIVTLAHQVVELAQAKVCV